MTDHTVRVCSFNVGKPDAYENLRRLLDEADVNIIGAQELGDQTRALDRLDATVLRKPKGGANRVALILSGVQHTDWGVTALPGAGDDVERTIAGNSDGTAENKFIVWADVDGLRYGNTHLIPSTARRNVTGGYKHPLGRDVYRKQVQGCVAWFKAGGDVLMGDMNAVPDYDLLEPLRVVATVHTRPSHGTRAIDQVWVRKGSGVDVAAVTALPGYTSDHRPVVADLTPPTPQEEAPVVMLTQLADVARRAGLKVHEVDGWKQRGRPASTGGFNPVGVLVHHTATAKTSSDAAVVDLLVRGRRDLPGPLCQLGLGRDGTVYVIAAGRANHAGTARKSGTVAAGDGNTLYIGVEAFNDGRGEPWPEVQYNAYVRLCAALSREVTGGSAATVRGHKETSVTGKVDPTFSMDAFRSAVDAALKGGGPRPAPKVSARARAGEIVANRAKGVKRADVKAVLTRIAKRLRS